MSDTKGRLEELVRDDKIDTDRDRQIDEAGRQLLLEVTAEGIALQELAQRVTALGVSESILGEALSRLLYEGAVVLTGDRRLVPR